MPTAAEIRERIERLTSRLHVFANQSTQQVRALSTRGADYVQLRFNAFSNTCRGRKTEDAQNWSSSTTERNSQNRDSSKDQMNNS